MKIDSIRRAIIQILAGNGEAGYEIMVDEFGGERGEQLYRTLESSPELTSIDHLCQMMCGVVPDARHETQNICGLLESQAERLIEIGQEESQDGLLFSASILTAVSKAITASTEYHNERRAEEFKVYSFECFETREEYHKLVVEEMQFESVERFEEVTGATFDQLKGRSWELVNNRVFVKDLDQ